MKDFENCIQVELKGTSCSVILVVSAGGVNLLYDLYITYDSMKKSFGQTFLIVSKELYGCIIVCRWAAKGNLKVTLSQLDILNFISFLLSCLLSVVLFSPVSLHI